MPKASLMPRGDNAQTVIGGIRYGARDCIAFSDQ
jgi:hypothetical protein